MITVKVENDVKSILRGLKGSQTDVCFNHDPVRYHQTFLSFLVTYFRSQVAFTHHWMTQQV